MDPLVFARYVVQRVHRARASWASILTCRNNVQKYQRIYQADTRPVFLRLPGSKLYFGTFLTLFTVGIVGVAGGTFNAIMGKRSE